MRFDEIELEAVPVVDAPQGVPERRGENDAPRMKRLLALLTDLSLFAALSLALAPLLPIDDSWLAFGALTGFVFLVSYYYFVGSWLLWGKTIGGAIFDVRVVADDGGPMTLRAASLRWGALVISLATGGIGFLLAVLPSRRSLPDHLSNTGCVAVS